MSKNKLRFGYLSTANIARKNWMAIRNSGNSTITTVGSRNLEKCQRFIDECQAEAPMDSKPVACASYEAVLKSKDVDAVYIPLPTGLRKEWVIRAAEAGKHIVCEKPCSANLPDLREMLAACKKNNVQFMDGVMFMHSLRLDRMRQALDQENAIGKIKRITSAFSFFAEEDFFTSNIRADSTLEPLGSLGDLGWYCVRLALWVMKEELPEQVAGRILSTKSTQGKNVGVPTEFSGELLFANGVSSSFYCSFLTQTEQWGIISGATGLLKLSDFVLPFYGSELKFEIGKANFEVTGCRFNMEPREQTYRINEYSNNHPTSQETNLFRDFSSQVMSGQLKEAWPQAAWNTQSVVNACLQSAQNGSALTVPEKR